MKLFKNKKASHQYFISETLETGIVLVGTEIKSIRAGKVNFKDSYGRIINGEIWLYNLHIGIYTEASFNNHNPERSRKLLLNRNEIKKLTTKVDERGFTLIPTELYINEKGIVKITLGVAKGKHFYDKRADLRKKDEKRDLERREKY